MRSPAVFLAHGAPLSALGGDEHAAALREFGEKHQQAKGILVISAHWQVSKPVRLTAWDRMPLLYDFGGFPDELYRIEYPAPGDPGLAARAAGVLRAEGQAVAFDTTRGLDHGGWVPLRLASMPFLEPPDLFQLGRALRPLRDDGVLVVGSGGIVHNLSRVRLADKNAPVDPWAAEFDGWVAERVAARNLDQLFAYRRQGPHARLSVPTTEHFDPLFVALGAAYADERLDTIFEGFHYGNLSMRSFAFS